MRQVLAVVMVVVSGCGKSDHKPAFDCAGDVTITNSADMEAFAAQGCTSVTGILTISGIALTTFSLPALTGVGQYLRISGNTVLTNFSLPSLTTVDVLEISSNPALISVSMPALRSVAGPASESSMNTSLAKCGGWGWNVYLYWSALAICENDALASVDMPSLHSADSATILGNPALTSVYWPSLTTISRPISRACGPAPCRHFGGLNIIGEASAPAGPTGLSLPALATGELLVYSASVATLDLPALTTGSVWVLRGTALASLSLPALTTGLVIVEGTLTSLSLPALTTGGVGAWGSALTSLSLPALTTAPLGLTIIGNTDLASVSAPALTTVGSTDPALWTSLYVVRNTALTSLDLPALRTVVGLGSSYPALAIADNTAYPQCAAEAILAHLTAAPSGADLSGNDTTATCPP